MGFSYMNGTTDTHTHTVVVCVHMKSKNFHQKISFQAGIRKQKKIVK